jgi:hypothetical protein
LANTDARKPTLRLVHRAWHGAWCWKDLEAEYAESEWATTSIELPSAMRTTSLPEPLPGMHADAQAIRTALAHIDGPVAMSELVSHSPRSFAETVTRTGWREVPSTYVVCTEDQSLPPKLQERFALHAGTVERLAACHSPFLSIPAALARLPACWIDGEQDRRGRRRGPDAAAVASAVADTDLAAAWPNDGLAANGRSGRAH